MNPCSYRGYDYDEESGLYYLQSRYYNPETGRFLNADDTAFLGASGNGWVINIKKIVVRVMTSSNYFDYF